MYIFSKNPPPLGRPPAPRGGCRGCPAARLPVRSAVLHRVLVPPDGAAVARLGAEAFAFVNLARRGLLSTLARVIGRIAVTAAVTTTRSPRPESPITKPPGCVDLTNGWAVDGPGAVRITSPVYAGGPGAAADPGRASSAAPPGTELVTACA